MRIVFICIQMPKPPATAIAPVRRPRWVRVWGWPIALGLLTSSGLVAALLSPGAGHVWAWLALGLTVGVMAWFACIGSPRNPS